jgi:hypothetical protein
MSERDSTRGERRIEVPLLARVEGEGALDLTIDDGRIAGLRLRIFEPPRLFERFLVGFWRAPARRDAGALALALERALPAAEDLVRWTAPLPLPSYPQQFDCVSLRHPVEYPMMAERIVSESGLDIPVDHF